MTDEDNIVPFPGINLALLAGKPATPAVKALEELEADLFERLRLTRERLDNPLDPTDHRMWEAREMTLQEVIRRVMQKRKALEEEA